MQPFGLTDQKGDPEIGQEGSPKEDKNTYHYFISQTSICCL
jgi:hypothetical protein